MKISKTAKFKNFLTENNFEFIYKLQENGEKIFIICIDNTNKDSLLVEYLSNRNCFFHPVENTFVKMYYVSF